MNEIERAIELFKDEVRILYGHGNLSSPESIDAHELALKLLRAELSRQENAPLTCEGCEHEEYSHNDRMISYSKRVCYHCFRLDGRKDCYAKKEEPTCTQD